MRLGIVLGVLLSALAACASNDARVESAWREFQGEHAAALDHAGRVVPAVVAEAQRQGDDELAFRVSTPPEGPEALLCQANVLAAVSYEAGDEAGIHAALLAVRDCESRIAQLERERAGR